MKEFNSKSMKTPPEKEKKNEKTIAVVGLVLVFGVMVLLFVLDKHIRPLWDERPVENSTSQSSQLLPEASATPAPVESEAEPAPEEIPNTPADNQGDLSLLDGLYNYDMSHIKEPKDLLEDEVFMETLKKAGIPEEEIIVQITEMQETYEAMNNK